MHRFLLSMAAVCALLAREPDVALSKHAPSGFSFDCEPAGAPMERHSRRVCKKRSARGEPVPGHRTEIRSRWTSDNIYFLFICPYQELNLKPRPSTARETHELWNWDVAEEFFVGSDFKQITRYKEFEISPQGEWVDLDIDRLHELPEGGWLWNSGSGWNKSPDRCAA